MNGAQGNQYYGSVMQYVISVSQSMINLSIVQPDSLAYERVAIRNTCKTGFV